jgi:hypothetical protein
VRQRDREGAPGVSQDMDERHIAALKTDTHFSDHLSTNRTVQIAKEGSFLHQEKNGGSCGRDLCPERLRENQGELSKVISIMKQRVISRIRWHVGSKMIVWCGVINHLREDRERETERQSGGS